MNIYGEKVILRAIMEEDAPLLLEMINDPETERMLGGASLPVSIASQIKWIQQLQVSNNDEVRLIISERYNIDKGLGTVILSDIDRKNGVAQIHIKLGLCECRGKGYGTDAIKTLVRYAFEEMRLNCIYANVLSYNTASKKMFLASGFRLDGILRKRVYKCGKYIDVCSYSIIKEDI